MKTVIYIMAMAAMLAGCSSEDEFTQSSYPADNVVRVTANVNDIQKRATYTTSTLAEFGIGIQNQKNEKYSYGNYKVTKSGSIWSPATQMLWENAKRNVNIYAYAPYNPNYTRNIYQETNYPVSVSADQTPDTDKSDFLLFKCYDFKPSEDLVNGCVPISFNHALSLLKVNITFRDEFNADTLLTGNPITQLKVNGTKLNAVCNFATQNVNVVETASASPVTARQDSFTAATAGNRKAQATYSCILVPQTVAAHGFSISISAKVDNSNEVFNWTSYQAVTLESGKSHQLDLVLGKEGVIVGNITVKDWNTGNAITVVAQ